MGLFNKKSSSPSPKDSVAKRHSATEFIEELKVRRSIYHLTKELPIPEKKVTEIVKAVTEETPTSFNAQPVRAIILYGDKHTKLWGDIAVTALKAVVPEAQWKPTGEKLKAFAAAAGTVLFFEEEAAIKKSQDDYPAYAAAFPIFASQSSGAAHINTWSALALENIGGNLQHYSPLIDAGVAEAFNVPETWKLKAQLVFGGIGSPAGPKETRRDLVTVA